jgi:ketosteroid isomerase-like protein
VSSVVVKTWLGERCGDSDVEVVMHVRDGRDAFVEGRTADLTCAASLQLGGDGLIARSLFFSCAPVTPPEPVDGGELPPVWPLLERYFTALNDGAFDAAAACFAEDCLYSHPPYRPGEPQAEFHGRRELAELWPSRRGTRRVETTIDACVQRGNHAFVEGVAAGGSFLSTIVLAPDGLISRYLAFYTPTLVPRLANQDADG